MTSDGFRFSVLGVPVLVRPSFLLVTLMLGLTSSYAASAVWLVAAFACILVHELGHALTARAFGHTARIELHGLGGTAFHSPSNGEGARALSTTQQVLVSLAGPGAGFVVGLVALPLRDAFAAELAHRAVADVVWITLGYGVLNLVPIMPLDGGHVVSALLARFGARAARLQLAVDVVAAAALVGGAVWLESPRLGFLVAWLVISRARTAWTVVATAREERDSDYVAFEAARVANDQDAMVRHGTAVLPRLKLPAPRAYVAHSLAWAHFQARRFSEASDAIALIPEGYGVDAFMRGSVLYALGHYADAIAPLRTVDTLEAKRTLVSALTKTGAHDDAVALARALAVDPGGAHESKHALEAALFFAGRHDEALDVSAAIFAQYACERAAYNAACACCRVERDDDAVAWFTRAVDEGWRDRKAADGDHDLDRIRARPDFLVQLARVSEGDERDDAVSLR